MKNPTIIKNMQEKKLHDLLMNDEDTISIEEAMAEAEKRWPNQKRPAKSY